MTRQWDLFVQAVDEFADLAEALSLLAETAETSPGLQKKLPGMVNTVAKKLAKGLRNLAAQIHEGK